MIFLSKVQTLFPNSFSGRFSLILLCMIMVTTTVDHILETTIALSCLVKPSQLSPFLHLKTQNLLSSSVLIHSIHQQLNRMTLTDFILTLPPSSPLIIVLKGLRHKGNLKASGAFCLYHAHSGKTT